MESKLALFSRPHYYLHAVDPHAGAEFADLYFDGRKYGITACEEHPLSQVQFIIFLREEDVDDVLRNNAGKLVDRRRK